MSKGNPDVSGTESERKSRVRSRKEASFPVPAGKTQMPAEYAAVLGELKKRIQSERLHATLAANSAMVLLYWDIGKVILDRQERQGWGAKVIDRLSHDLKTAFPDMSGLSPRNLKYMRKFAEAWPEREIVQGSLAQITWYHNIALLEKISEPETRIWYAHRTSEEGWSRNILAMQIESNLHERQGKAITNFDMSLPPTDSDMAAQVFKDPYLFDFLGTADPRKEREVEQGLMDHIQRFLLELGEGLDEESLAIFDLLKKQNLSASDIKQIKAVAVGLLRKLKAKKLRVDHWRDKEATRDAVRVTISNFLWSDKTGLPVESYTEDDVKTISNEVFRHVYRAYPTVPSPCYAEAA